MGKAFPANENRRSRVQSHRNPCPEAAGAPQDWFEEWCGGELASAG